MWAIRGHKSNQSKKSSYADFFENFEYEILAPHTLNILNNAKTKQQSTTTTVLHKLKQIISF